MELGTAIIGIQDNEQADDDDWCFTAISVDKVG